jgi:hypothetical protein
MLMSLAMATWSIKTVKLALVSRDIGTVRIWEWMQNRFNNPPDLHSHLIWHLLLTYGLTDMFKRQFGTLAIAMLLLSPGLVSANEAIAFTDLSVGDIQITTSDRGTLIATPNIFIATPTTTDSQILSRQQPSIRSNKITVPTVRPRVEIDDEYDDDEPVATRSSFYRISPIPSIPQIPFVRSIPTLRGYSVRTTSVDRDTFSEQRQSVQCSGGGTVTQSSSTTVNGRTVKTQFRHKCK